jgi:hypothetical protein
MRPHDPQHDAHQVRPSWWQRLLDALGGSATAPTASPSTPRRMVSPPHAATLVGATARPSSAPHRDILWPSRADPAAPHAQVWWVLNPDDPYPCPECQAFARRSPYGRPGSGRNELDATPGDGHTRCGAACSCALRYDPPVTLWTPHRGGGHHGRLAFARMELYFVEGEEPRTDAGWVDLMVRGIQWAHPTREELARVLKEMGVEPRSERWRLAMTRVLDTRG